MAGDLSSVYYDTEGGFAESVTGPSGAIVGIFTDEYLELDADGSVIATGSAPTLRTLEADAIAAGATVTIRAVDYTVIEVMPNGYGETIHRLREA